MRRTKILAMVAALAVVPAFACDGGDGPSGPEPGIDVRGTYQGTHTFMVSVSGSSITFTCPGGITISSSSGETISGTLDFEPCEALELTEPTSTPLAGTVASNGSIRFVVQGQEFVFEGFRQEGCTIVEEDEEFSGQLVQGTLTVELGAVLECEDVQGQVEVTWRIEASRTG